MSAEFLISLCWNFLWTKPALAVCSLQALDKWGTVDILVNNAGTYSYQVFAPLHHQDARAVAETFLS
jgi:NADP-dependent 3-hydroxy acid dehydrogenase YdfG